MTTRIIINRSRWLLPMILGLSGSPSALAQLPNPDLRTVFPPGATSGESIEVSISGTQLEETTELVFSHPGIRCERIAIPGNEIRPERHEPLRYRVMVASNVPAGTYEVHARTRAGLSAPRGFAVGSHPETVHAADNGNPATPMPLPHGTVVNAYPDNEGIDYYRLELKRDQRVIIQCRGEPIDSRIDATLVLRDSKGRELLRDRDTLGRDALLDFTTPEDGPYTLMVFDFTYRGGNEYPYRLLASSAPHIDFVYPPAGKPGTTGKFKVYGRNLPGGSPGEGVRLGRHQLESVEVDIDLAEQDDPSALVVRPVHSSLVPGMEYYMEAGGLKSNPVRIGYATAPVVEAIESEDDQGVTVPCEVHGRFDRRNDLDRYRFEAKKGVAHWIECLAERIGRGSDPLVIVERVARDENGNEQIKELASDDDAGTGSGGKHFTLLTRDAALRFTPPEDGTYRVAVLNQTGSGGPAAIYRLIVRPAAPSFELVATPWLTLQGNKQVNRLASVLRKGGTTALRVFAIRSDGFDDEITLTAEGLPEGVTCPPVKLRKGTDHATLVFQCTEDAPSWQGFVTVKGTSGELVRVARTGAISWSVSDYDRDYAKPRLGKRLALSVWAEEKAAMIVQPGQLKYEVDLDGKLEIPFKLVKNFGAKGEYLITPVGLPYTKNPPQLKLKQDAGEGKLAITFKKTNEFPVEAGKWQFTLRAEGIVKHRNNLSGLARAEEERKRVEELEKTLAEAAQQARAAVEPASQAVQEAQKNLESATPESKAKLEAALKNKQDELKSLEEAAKAAEEKAKLATTEKNAAAERAKQAGERAKERELKHATHSPPITVIVKAPPPKEEGK